MFDERTKKYFLMLAQEGNITRAAQKLFVSQPSLSKFLSVLEEKLGTKLLDRSAAPLRLTTAGERFLEYLQHDEQLYENFFHEISNAGYSEHENLIRLGTGPRQSEFLLSNVYPKFCKEHPNVEVRFYEEVNQNLRAMLLKKQIDMTITPHPATNTPYEVAPSYEFLYSERILILISKKHPLASIIDPKTNSPFTPSLFDLRLLEGQRLITGKPGQRLTDDVCAIITKYGLTIPESIGTVNINSAILMASYNMGIALVPQSYLCELSLPDSIAYFYSNDPLLTWLENAEYASAHPTIAERSFVALTREIGNIILNSRLK